MVFVRDFTNLFVSDYRYRATALDKIGGSIERLGRLSKRAMEKTRGWTEEVRQGDDARGGRTPWALSKRIIATVRGIDNAIKKWDERGL